MHLLIHRDGRCALDVTKGVDRGTDTEIADTLDTDIRRLILTVIAVLTVLDRTLANPIRMAPTSLPRTSRPLRALRARTASSRRSKLTGSTPSATAVHTKIIEDVLKPQFFCVRTRADPMGPYGLNTQRIVADVVVEGMEPIQRAPVGVDWS